MYRYLVFEYDCYYPSGGMDDCKLKTNKLEEAMEFMNNSDWDYIDIYDCVEDCMIQSKSNR